MRSNFKKKLLAFGVAIAVIVVVLACAGGDEYDYSDYSLFAPEIIQQPASRPFFLSYHFFYPLPYYEIPKTEPTVTGRNTAEWVAFFKNSLTQPQVEWLVYGSSIRSLEMLATFKPKSALPDSIDRQLAEALATNKLRKPILDYLILAKDVEPLFNPEYYSWDAPVYDTVTIAGVIKGCKALFSKTSNSFLKNRYGFQVTRALSIAGLHNECISFFDTEFKPTPEAGGMYYRSLGYKARSLYKKGDYTQANYVFSRLFVEDASSRYTAFQGFHPQEEEDWNATLQLAKSTQEKEVLWQLLGIYADPVRAIEEIYNLNPQSEYMPLLLVRAVNMAEANSLSNPIAGWDGFNYDNYSDMDESSDDVGYYDLSLSKTDQKILRNTITRILKERKVDNPALWQLSYSYLSILGGDYKAAEQALFDAQPAAGDSLMQGQKAIIKGVLAVKMTKEINNTNEDMLFRCLEEMREKDVKELRTHNAVQYIISNLSVLYKNAGDDVKSELAFPLGEHYYTGLQQTQNMIDFINRPTHSRMEAFLIERYPLKKADLHDIKAKNYIYAYNFQQAIKEYEMESGAGANELLGNPFTIHVTDCHDCDHLAPKKTTYSNRTFALKMLELKAKGDTLKNTEEQAQNYFLYANGLYNMTWYGNARTVRDTKLSGYYYGEEENPSFYDCREALAYYNQAAALTTNKEFKAKCTWMAAKCEHNIWIENGSDDEDYSWSYRSNPAFVPGKYFVMMKKDFADTKYYNEVLKECGYFCTYITRSKDCIRYKEED